MALPTIQDVKDQLRITTAAEDAHITKLLARAKALVEGYLRRPILGVARTFTVDGGFTLHLPLYPVNPTGLIVRDVVPAVVDAATYRLDRATGEIIADEGVIFDNGPYSVDASVGLEYAEDYATVIEPVLSTAIVDVAADLYWHRNPNSTSESEAGASVSYGRDGIPPRVAKALDPYRRAGVRA